ncbi:MAG: M23 family metallopeptidase [Deltaproteobacteria bacterium]|nr:M23 family metallopeptidase [Deltaproteobacteria bacterium]
MFRRLSPLPELPGLPARFGIRSRAQLLRDVGEVVRHLPQGDRYTFSLASASLLRPDLSLPAYAGLLPSDGVAPIFNFFDRHGGAHDFRATVRRSPPLRDFRGGRLSYDEHDGTDFVCPPGTPLVAAAPGIVATTRDRWLRGGLTLCIDHGDGVVTQYTHLTKACVEPGQRVERGEIVALSGVTGLDMTQFFPWVPPHVHFMAWVDGEPVDPFLSAGEAPRAGTWAAGNDPETVQGPLPGDPSPREIVPRIDERALEEVCAQCTDPRIVEEIERAPSTIARAAIVEDSLHHDRPAWRRVVRPARLRPLAGDPTRVRLTLPLPASLYTRARAADAPWTRPR